MRYHRWFAAILSALMILMLSACNNGGQNQIIDRPDNDTPSSIYEGFYASTQSYHGGDAIYDANIKHIAIRQLEQETVITLDFVVGSTAAGVQEDQADNVPSYMIYCLPEPNRLVVNLENIAYYDYPVPDGIGQGTPVSALFRQILLSSSSTSLFFNFDREMAYKVEERQNSLTIRLKQLEAKKEPTWHVAINAYPDYIDGIIPVNKGFSPTICQDLSNKLLVSKPFATQQAAQEFMDSQEVKLLMEGLSNRVCTLISILPGTLPAYDHGFDLQVVKEKKIAKINDEERSLPLIMMGGRWLATSPHGDELFAKTPLDQSQMEAGDGFYPEQLWLLQADGQLKLLCEMDFYIIIKAIYSPDGTKIAFIDMGDTSIGLYTVYVLDTQSGMLINASEEGLGLNAFSIAWENDQRLFAMSGMEDEYQLMVYDFSEVEGSRAKAFDEEPGSQGDMAIDHGMLYYTDYLQGIVYRVNLSDRTRSELCKGNWMILSPNGKYLVALELIENEDQVDQGILRLRNLQDGTETVIAENAVFESFKFAADGTLYYTLNDSATDAEFPMQLYQYQPGQEPKLMARLSTPVIDAGADAEAIYIIDQYQFQDMNITVTYQFPLE